MVRNSEERRANARLNNLRARLNELRAMREQVDLVVEKVLKQLCDHRHDMLTRGIEEWDSSNT